MMCGRIEGAAMGVGSTGSLGRCSSLGRAAARTAKAWAGARRWRAAQGCCAMSSTCMHPRGSEPLWDERGGGGGGPWCDARGAVAGRPCKASRSMCCALPLLFGLSLNRLRPANRSFSARSFPATAPVWWALPRAVGLQRSISMLVFHSKDRRARNRRCQPLRVAGCLPAPLETPKCRWTQLRSQSATFRGAGTSMAARAPPPLAAAARPLLPYLRHTCAQNTASIACCFVIAPGCL